MNCSAAITSGNPAVTSHAKNCLPKSRVAEYHPHQPLDTIFSGAAVELMFQAFLIQIRKQSRVARARSSARLAAFFFCS
jgi:hypothetical protein